MQVGMRHYHKTKNNLHCPIVNLDKIWSLVGEEVRLSRFNSCRVVRRAELIGRESKPAMSTDYIINKSLQACIARSGLLTSKVG